MMRISLACRCGRTLSVAEESAGGEVGCPHCGARVVVPPLGRLVAAQHPTRVESQPRRRRWMPWFIGSSVAFVFAAVAIGWAMIAAEPAAKLRIHEATPAIHETNGARDRTASTLPRDTKPEDLLAARDPAPKDVPAPRPVEEPKSAPTSQLPPKTTTPSPKPVAPKPAASKLLQELIITQKPTFRIQGISQPSILQYRIVSTLDVRTGDGGTLVVRQTIEQAELSQADAATRAVLAGAIAGLPKTSLTFHLDRDRRVTKFEGWTEGTALGPVLGGDGLRLSSLLDRDGWKEMAQLTFFQPGKRQVKERWSRPMTHHWGPLGDWAGRILYQRLPNQGPAQVFAYAMELGYKPPPANAKGLLQVNAAQFQLQEAAGRILFDEDRQRVVSAEERFRVRGVLSINLLGLNTPAEIEEEQHFSLRITGKNDD